jgi:hypothetical protein
MMNSFNVQGHRPDEPFVDLVALLVQELNVCELTAEKICGAMFQFLSYQLEAGQYDALFARFPQATGWIEQAQHLEDIADNSGQLSAVLQHLTYELGGNLGSVTTLLVQLERSGVSCDASPLIIRSFIQLLEEKLPASLARAVDARMTFQHPHKRSGGPPRTMPSGTHADDSSALQTTEIDP